MQSHMIIKATIAVVGIPLIAFNATVAYFLPTELWSPWLVWSVVSGVASGTAGVVLGQKIADKYGRN